MDGKIPGQPNTRNTCGSPWDRLQSSPAEYARVSKSAGYGPTRYGFEIVRIIVFYVLMDRVWRARNVVTWKVTKRFLWVCGGVTTLALAYWGIKQAGSGLVADFSFAPGFSNDQKSLVIQIRNTGHRPSKSARFDGMIVWLGVSSQSPPIRTIHKIGRASCRERV